MVTKTSPAKNVLRTTVECVFKKLISYLKKSIILVLSAQVNLFLIMDSARVVLITVFSVIRFRIVLSAKRGSNWIRLLDSVS